jgi:prepilin-type N-terminal cleavage/methylation domain-containing protein
MKKSPAKKSGFTLIEIVIVLAIAALIMVIVFVAVQGAQRSRRDTTVRNNAAQTLAAMEQYASNTSGAYPTATLATGYTTGITPTPTYSTTAPTTTSRGTVYASSQTCNADKNAYATGTANQVAVLYWSESSGGVVCINN